MVGDDFHRQMRFAIRRPSPHRSAHPGRIFGIDPVHVERHVIAHGAASRHAERLFHHRAHAALVNVAHGEYLDAGLTNILFFNIVDIANADQHAVFGRDLR